MKATRFSLTHCALGALTACLLSAPLTQAQTYTGQDKLQAAPTSFDAVVYPLKSQPSKIRINFNNRTTGQVRVTIRDEKGNRIYDEYEAVAQYRRYFDFSPMEAGTYTIELSKKNDTFTQTFTIEPPTASRITMASPPVRKTPELPIDTKLIVSQ